MISDQNLPDGWQAGSRTAEYDRVMDREFESVRYDREDGEAVVRINEVQEPKDFEGWAYQVVVEYEAASGADTAEEDLGLFESLESARQAALDFMDGDEG